MRLIGVFSLIIFLITFDIVMPQSGVSKQARGKNCDSGICCCAAGHEDGQCGMCDDNAQVENVPITTISQLDCSAPVKASSVNLINSFFIKPSDTIFSQFNNISLFKEARLNTTTSVSLAPPDKPPSQLIL